jgi:hypothetical protein
VEPHEASGIGRRTRTAIVAVLAAVVLGAAWFAWRGFLAPAPPAAGPNATPTPSPTASAILAPAPVFVPPFRVAHFRDGGQPADVEVYRRFDGNLCVRLLSRSFVSCDVLPSEGKAVRLTYADWMYLDPSCCRFGVFVVGTVGPDVGTVRVDLGGGRRVEATIVELPSALDEPARVFFVQRETGFASLGRRLLVTALDDRGREVGRTTYLVSGG